MKNSMTITSKQISKLVLFLLTLSACAAAQNVTGTVRNGTTGKPAAGVEVILLDLSQGMNESATTKADAQGKYSLPLSGGQAPHLVRVNFQGAGYFKMVPPGSTTADIDIYDSARKLDGITGTVRVIRTQTDGNTLQVLELYAVNNKSNPPRTVAGDNTFEIVLPEGAHLTGADAQGPNGQPITTSPTELKQKNHYAFSFPLRPGETRFQVSYHMPYSGDMTFAPQNLIPFDHFVAVLPPTMTFEAKNAAQFSPMPDQSGTIVQVATNVRPGQDVSFRVAGTGVMPDDQQQDQSSASGAAMGTQGGGPGGGLGRPIDAPDPLNQYRWWILGGLAIVMTGGAYLASTRAGVPKVSAAAAAAIAAPPAISPAAIPPSAPSPSAPTADTSSTLLEAMKEELFQLELERQRGQISPEEYAMNKAALDQTLQRALSRLGKR